MEVQAKIRGGLMLLDPHAPPNLEEVGDIILDLDLESRRANADGGLRLDDLTLSALQLVGLGDSFQLVFGGVGLVFVAMLRKPDHARVAQSWSLPWGAVRIAVLDVLEVERYSPGVSLVGPAPVNIRALDSAAVPPSTRSLLVQRLEYDNAPVVHGMVGSPSFPALAIIPSDERVPQAPPPLLELDEPPWKVGHHALAVVRGASADGVDLRLGSDDSGQRGHLRTSSAYERNLILRVRLEERRDDGVWRVSPAVVHL